MPSPILSLLFTSLIITGQALLFLGGLSLEYYSVMALFSVPVPIFLTPLQILGVHFGANFLSAWGLSAFLPPIYRKQRVRSAGYYFLIGFFIPMIGSVGLFIVDLLGIRRQKTVRKNIPFWRITNPALMPFRVPQVQSKSKFGPHGMLSRLRKSNDLKAHLGIVMATRFMRDEHAVPLLNVALRNPQDDVRLLAFTLLEKKIATINTNIEKLQKSIGQKANSAKVRVSIAKNYLRQVTLGLVQDEMRAQVLGLAGRNVEEALARDPDSRNAHFILGQVRLEQGRIEEAETAFNRALVLGFAANEIYPFLAQAAYRRREFHKIPQYLRQIPKMHRRYAPLANVAAYWLSDSRPETRFSRLTQHRAA